MSAVQAELLSLIEKMDDQQQVQLLQTARRMVQTQRLYTARELLHLPIAEREQYIAQAFAQAADEDFEIFEANMEEDMDDSE